MTVDVLGTHVNIMAYGDEQIPAATLLEGRVRVRTAASSELLWPGQAASMNRTSQSLHVADADTEEATAWKDGFFQFSNADLPLVMRQLSRWYDIDVTYEGIPRPYEFVGRITRRSNLSSVLKILEANGVRFRIEGKKVIVIQS